MAASPASLSLSTDRSQAEALQLSHYQSIATEYDRHYNDQWSQEYMLRFVFENMFRDVPLEGANVLEAMCGGGQATSFLLERNALVTGLDISPQQTANFQRRHASVDVICGSILSTGISDASLDVVAVIGGIHHTPPYEVEAIAEIHRILKPGGYFCFMEPHSESLAETFRKAWYKMDHLFAENEAAISIKSLHREFSDRFDFRSEQFLGNLGYLFVLNSMVFRIPHGLKRLYSTPLIRAERLLNRLLGKSLSCFVVGRWQKK